MLAVPDAARAVSGTNGHSAPNNSGTLVQCVGLNIQGAAFFLGEPSNNGWESPEKLGMPSDALKSSVMTGCIHSRALAAGATAGRHRIQVHATPWGPHRQGGFVDPFGHIWFVGDDRRSLGIRAGRRVRDRVAAGTLGCWEFTPHE